MFVVDTNILIYAADQRSQFYPKAKALVENWMQSLTPWYATWGIFYEFMRVATHPSVSNKPWSWQQAAGFVDALL